MSTEQSVIHDIGYQRYAGVRLGRGYAFRALYTHSLRTAFGLGRGVLAKIFPWFVVGVVILFAAVFIVIRTQTGQAVGSYEEFADGNGLLLIMFCAAVAPELVSRDLRTGVLSLYFSRPIEREDYPLAKLGALVTALWLLLAGAQVLIFAGAAFSVDRLGQVWDELLDLLPALAYSAAYAAVFGSLALLVASLASRRAVAAAVVVATFLVPTPVVGVLSLTGSETAQRLAGLASPMTLVHGLGQWLFDVEGTGPGAFGPLYGVTVLTVVFACTVALVVRYRRVAS
ncbi:MAG TPA: ABC transporter permease [Micromonosporaceae bacterium]|nr:ABC transporter permease [Micromonosporaceae bacterium]